MSKRGQRANEKERKRKNQQERERLLAKEIKSKKLNLNNPGEKISDICFSGELAALVESGTQTEDFQYLFSTAPQKPFEAAEFCNDNKKVNFYTGLPSFHILNIIFHQIEPFVTRKSQNLSAFQEFIMALMKLKLNMPLADLAYRFNVSVPTVSRTF